PVSLTEQFDLCPFTDWQDVYAVALVRSNVETLSQDAANPAVSNGPVILERIPLAEYRHNVRQRDHRAIGAGHEIGDNLEDLRFNRHAAVCDEAELRLKGHGSELGSQILIGDDAQERKQN